MLRAPRRLIGKGCAQDIQRGVCELRKDLSLSDHLSATQLMGEIRSADSAHQLSVVYGTLSGNTNAKLAAYYLARANRAAQNA